MNQTDYSTTLEWLFNQFPSYQNLGPAAYKPDLDNIKYLLTQLGEPQQNLRFIHVAGTNGKGSTCSMLASILTASGEKVGLFTSPHIKDFRERIRINGSMISEQFIIDFCKNIQQLKLEIQPSFFEISFAMALAYFRQEHCTICVIETGLGGRLDATNVIRPFLSIITNISLEHTHLLGNTLEAIAGEKAGIIKEHVPCIIGSATAATQHVFEQKAATQKAPIIFCDKLSSESNKFKTPLLGTYQQENLQTVLIAVQSLNNMGYNIIDTQIQEGLDRIVQNTGFFGRMQIINEHPLVILDVSHNEAGIKQTLESMKHLNKGKLHLIYGSSSDKDYRQIIQSIPADTSLNLCSFKNERSLSHATLESLAMQMESHPPVFEDVNSAIETVKTKADQKDTILVFGSFFLISDYFF